MKLTVETKALSSALKRAGTCTKKADTILGHVLLEAEEGGLRISASCFEREVKLYVPATVQEPGSRTAHGELLTNFANCAQDENTHIDLLEERLFVKSGKAWRIVPSLDPDCYRGLATQVDGINYSFRNNEFQRVLNEVSCCASSEEFRGAALMGVYVHAESRNEAKHRSTEGRSGDEVCDWILAATDTEKLMEVRINAPDTPTPLLKSFIYPTQSAKIAAALFPEEATAFDVFVSRTMVTISNDHTCFTSVLMDGIFPEGYARVLKPGPHVMKVDREDFVRAVEIASVAKLIKITPRPEGRGLSLHSQRTDTAQGNAEIDVEGSIPYEVTIKAELLESALRALHGSTITMHFGAKADDVILLTNGREGVSFVVKPYSLPGQLA